LKELDEKIRETLSPETLEKYEVIMFHGYVYYEAGCKWDEIRDKLERQRIINVSTDFLAKCFRAHGCFKQRFNPLVGDLKARVLGERANKKNAQDTQDNINKHVEEYLAKGGKITQCKGFNDNKVDPKARVTTNGMFT
jgi:hypothetical protein